MSNDDEHLVARLEERVASMQETIAALRQTIEAQRAALNDYVRLERYLRVEIAVFGCISVSMGALLIWAFNKLISLP